MMPKKSYHVSCEWDKNLAKITEPVLAGSKSKKVVEFGFQKLPTYGILKPMNAKEIANFIEFLIAEHLIAVSNGQFPTIFVSDEGKEVLTGQGQVSVKRTSCENSCRRRSII